MVRLVARLVYPFWRLWRSAVEGWQSGWRWSKEHEELDLGEALRKWLDNRAVYSDDPLERRPYRVTAVDGITISGPATDFVGVAKRGEVIWIERGVADALIREGSIELVDE